MIGTARQTRLAKTPCSAARGFTLVEVVMCVVIIATISAIAVPRYAAAASRYRVEAAARRVMGDLQTAQRRAVATSTTIAVTVTPGNKQYAVDMPDPDRPSQGYAIDLTADPYAVQAMSSTFGNGTSFSFNGFGLPSSGGTIVLQSGTATSTLTVNADTGSVTYVLQ